MGELAPVVTFEGVSVRYAGQSALRDVTAAFPAGAVGLLDRIAPLCFAAPVFFHSVRWYFKV